MYKRQDTDAHGPLCKVYAAVDAKEMFQECDSQLVPDSLADQETQQAAPTTPPSKTPPQEAEDAADLGKDVKCEDTVVSPEDRSADRAPAPSHPTSLPADSRRGTSKKMPKTVQATLSSSRSSDRRRSPRSGCALMHGKSTSRSSVTPPVGAGQRRTGCSRVGVSGKQRAATASSYPALAWKPAGTKRVQDTKRNTRVRSPCPQMQQVKVPETQCNGGGSQSTSTQKVQNRKENTPLQELAPEVDLAELKGLSRLPVLKTWEAHDFAVAQRLGFSLEEHILRHGRPEDDDSVTNSWTDEESAAEGDNQVTEFC